MGFHPSDFPLVENTVAVVALYDLCDAAGGRGTRHDDHVRSFFSMHRSNGRAHCRIFMTTELARKSLSAAKWGASSTLMRFFLQIAAQAILARLLGPQAYGIFAVGLIVMALTSLLTDVGFSWNLLRRFELSAADIQFALTGQIIFGAVLSILLYFGADFLAFHLAGEPVGWVIRLLAFSVIFNAAASTPSILLSRALDYRRLGKSQLWSYVAGYFLVGVPMALADAGAVSLVAAWLVQSVVRCWLSFRLCGLVWDPTFRHRTSRSFLADGALVFLTNMVNWLAYNLDRVTVSKWMASPMLGIYNLSANLAGTPNAILLGSIQPVFMATGARLQGVAALRLAYSGVLRAALMTVPPFYLALALGAEDLVFCLYGERWRDAGEVMGILFLGMPFFVIWSLSTPILWNTGKAHHEALLQLPIVLAAAVVYFFASSVGLTRLAWTADAVLVLRAGVVFAAASQRVGLPWRDLLPALWMGSAFSVAALAVHGLVVELSLPGPVRLAAAAAFTVAACLSLLKLLPYRLSAQAIGLIHHVSHRTAVWLQGGRHARA
ncbi:oligosaccharide flippase family protein [Xylophilus sp. Kf1]|nr:oligosaccharide flippase family protein [Xylophilus sp. Kf1]